MLFAHWLNVDECATNCWEGDRCRIHETGDVKPSAGAAVVGDGGGGCVVATAAATLLWCVF